MPYSFGFRTIPKAGTRWLDGTETIFRLAGKMLNYNDLHKQDVATVDSMYDRYDIPYDTIWSGAYKGVSRTGVLLTGPQQSMPGAPSFWKQRSHDVADP